MNAQLVSKFKAAKWASPAEQEAFLLETVNIEATTVLKILDLLTAKDAPKDALLHRKRCQVFVLVVDKCKNTALFVPLVKSLKAADPTLRSSLVQAIPKVNKIQEHNELCAALNHPDSQVRSAVSQLLAQLGGKTVLETLTQNLRSSSFQGRMEAIEVLVRVSGPYSLTVLEEVIVTGNRVPEKVLALKFLGEPKFFQKEAPRAVKVLSMALYDAVEQVAVQAINAFNKLCTEEDWFEALAPMMDSDRVATIRVALEGLKRFPSPRSIVMLERKLRGGPNSVRMSVLSVLEAIGTDDILGPLTDALGHKQQTVRNKASEVLANLGREGKLDLARTIIFLLKSRDVNVRRTAVELARTVKDASSTLWPKLLSVLRDEDWWVRERVVDVLVEMAGQQLTRHIVEFLKDPSDVVRRYAIDVLRRLKDPQSLGALLRAATEDADWWVREKALEAIAELKDARAVPYILQIMQGVPELRLTCLVCLKQMEATTTAAQVAATLADPDPDIRFAALDCLRAFNDPTHSAAVKPLSSDPELVVRNAARELLTLWNVQLATEGTHRDALSPLDQLLVAMAKQEADDLIMLSGRAVAIKKLGKVSPLIRNALSPEQVKSVLIPKLTSAQLSELDQMRDIDFSYEVKAEGLRFRANIFQEANGLAAVFRIIKGTIPDVDTLGLPEAVIELGELKNGLVLIGGPTGSGKSTTLAALIHNINQKLNRHIISLEDPIEVLHPSLKSLVNQREIGTHTLSFSNALRATLREDPNVILVGELRDLATIQFAVTAAETGHLVFGTVHTVSADTTVDRVVNAFPGRQQEQVRSMLAESLRAVVCQYLVRQKDGVNRCLAMEIMKNNEAIASLIRKGKAFQIPSVVATGRDVGMQLMDSDLMRLFKEGKVDIEEVYVKARSKKDFEPYMPQVAIPGQPPGGPPKAPANPAAAPQKPEAPTTTPPTRAVAS
jgi:twitching motility protein PilT